MKQQVHARFEAMQAVLKQDEQAVLETLDVDQKKTRTALDQVLKSWNQHLDLVSKSISNTQRALSKNPKTVDDGELEV